MKSASRITAGLRDCGDRILDGARCERHANSATRRWWRSVQGGVFLKFRLEGDCRFAADGGIQAIGVVYRFDEGADVGEIGLRSPTLSGFTALRRA
jgi:hypothetical protein